MNADLLVVEDHQPTRTEICRELRQAGYQVREAADGARALAELGRAPADLVISDYRMAPVDGLELLREVRRGHDVPFILYSSGADAEAIFRAGRDGAVIFLQYPFRVEDELIPTIRKTLHTLGDEQSEAETIGASRLIGSSDAMRRVRRTIRRVAQSKASVLVTGETGTGKELVARAIHEESGRDPFVAVAVTEFAEGLLESELFGHERGAFTGATGSRPGLFERADGGTLFLDEIGDAPLSLQAKILRTLETSEVRRVGGQSSRRVGVRIVAATHRDLEARVAEGLFREDLYYRIKQVAVQLPPLRERSKDMGQLAKSLLERLAQGAREAAPELAPDFVAGLCNHTWPGNVRELRTVLQNALLWWEGERPLGSGDLVEAFAELNQRLSADDVVTSQQMVDAYRRACGNQEAARRQLGLSRGEWRYRWRRYNLDVMTRRPR